MINGIRGETVQELIFKTRLDELTKAAEGMKQLFDCRGKTIEYYSNRVEELEKANKELENKLRIKTNMLKATENKVEELSEKLERSDKLIDAVQIAYKLLTQQETQNDTAKWEDCSNGWMCSACLRTSTFDYCKCPYCGKTMANGTKEQE